MAKETYLGANVEVTTDSFSGWINKTNEVRNDMGNIVVTVTKLANTEPSANNAGLTVGNAAIEGVLTVNTMAISADLRGGDVLTPATLIVSSNVHFTESANVWITSNTVNFDVNASNTNITSNTIITNTLTYVNSTNTTIGDAGTDALNVNSSSDFNANVNIDGILTQTANAIFSGALVNITSTNTTIGNAATDVLNVNAVSDFNANVNIDGITTHTANVSITDSDYILIGTDSDLQLYHDGSNSYIDEVGTGSLFIRATNLNVQSADGSDTYMTAAVNGAVALRYNNVEKFTTTSTGTDILGEVALKTAGTNQIVGESTTTAYQQLDFKLRTSAANERTPLVLTTSNTVIAGANSAYDLGSTATNWRHVYAKDTTTANSAIIQNVLTVNSQANTASMMVRDLTAGRVTYAGTGGELVDSANLTFSGSNLNVIGTANVTSNANVGGTFGVTGATTLASTLAVTGDATFSANVNLSDDDSINIGASQDLKIYHNGTNSYIEESGTGSLIIQSNNLQIRNAVNNETIASFIEDDAVRLYYDNSTRLATTAAGVTVTGELESTTLDVNGVADISGATTLGSTLGVTGETTLSSTLDVTGAITASNTVNITGNVTLSANLNLSDSDYIRLGAAQDMVIYHDGTHSYVKDTGTGNLKIDTSQLDIITSNSTVTETMATFVREGAVTLYWDNAAKLATKSDGILVTGELEASSLDVNGAADISGATTLGSTLNVTGTTTLAGMTATTGSFSSTLGITGTTTATAINASGIVNVTNTIDATSTTSAALKTAGGLGIAKTARIGGNAIISGNVTATGASTIATFNSANVVNNSQVGGTLTANNLTVTGTATINTDANLSVNNSIIAHATITDDLTLTNATIIDSIIPDANNSYDIGSSTAIWKTVYANNVVANVAWSSVTNKPDPVITVTLTGDVTGTGSGTLTDLGNGTISFATTYNNDVVLGTDTSGNYAGSVAAGSGINVSGIAGEGTTFTVSHADTSSVANLSIDNTNGTVIQDIALTFDTYGHVTGATAVSYNLDGRYYTETEADSRFVNVTGDTMSGALNMGGNVITGVEDIALADRIYHNGDTDTYIQFHAADQWRVVTGGIEQLEVNSTNTTVQNNFITASDATIGRNLIVSGNLTVSGTTTTVNTETVNIADNIIVLNSNYAGSTPSENGGIEIERGTLPNKSLVWDETNDRWTVGSETFVAGTFIGALTGNASTATTLQTSRTIALAGDVTGSASFNGGSNITITAAVANDSHTHDGRYYTKTESDARFLGIAANAVSASKWATARTLSLTGAVTGSVSIDGSGNVSLATTATSDPTLTLAGDATGSATFTNLGNATLNVTVANDSHTHDGRYYTETESDARFLGISAKAADSDLFDGLNSTSFLRSDAADVQTSGSLRFNDNIELYLGTSNDVTHVWDTANYVITQASGSTYLRTPTAVYFQDSDNANSTVFTFNMNTGALTATSFSGSGASLTSLNASNISSGTISDARLPATISSDITGNAATATTLATARTINGTSFNGSANITTANWGTSRTLTIGDTAKSVNGSGNYSWSRTELGITKTNIDALGINADTLDGLNSTSFLRSDAADVQTAGSLRFNDNIELYLGSGNDVTHFWSGTNYNITQTSGNLYLNVPESIYFADQTDFTTKFTFNMNSGDFTATGTIAGADVNSTSDARLKENVTPINNALNKVMDMRGVYFNRLGETERKLGVIAQEVEKVIPEVVNEAENGIKSVSYGNIVGLLIEAIKDLKAEIDELKQYK